MVAIAAIKVVILAAIFNMVAKTHKKFRSAPMLQIGQEIKMLERLQHISDVQTNGRTPGISISPRSALWGRGTINLFSP
jgi:hypothetical protein